MKLTSTIALYLFFLSILPAFAQKDATILINGRYESTPLNEVFQDIQTRYPVEFSYIKSQVLDYTVTVNFENEPLESALQIILEEIPLEFELRDKTHVILYGSPNKVLKKEIRFTLRGKVSDVYNRPIPNAVVQISYLKSTLTDSSGFYKISNIISGKHYVKYKADGYYLFSDGFKINENKTLNIQLTKASKISTNESSLSESQVEEDIFNKQMTLGISSGSLNDILREIELKGDIDLEYDSEEIPLDKQLVLNNTSGSLKDILNALFKNTNIGYFERENKIFLRLRKTKPAKYTISGTIKEKRTGENIIGATVVIKGTQIGTVTNAYGFFSLTVPEWEYTLVFSYVGYQPVKKEISLTKDTRIDIALTEMSSQLNEVVITAQDADDHVQKVEMSTNKVDIKTLKRMPAFLGEVDIVKSIILLPGVTTVGEGATGFNVRGGGIDQNLVLLDEAQVFNSSHLFGFFSVFNADVIKDAKLYKGGIPARFGGRLSSVLDIIQKEGNDKTFTGSGGIGVVSSRLSIEGPIIKDKASFIIAGRRSYADAFFKNKYLSKKLDFPTDNEAYFYDLNAKVNYVINPKNRIFLSGYFGRDFYKLGKDVAFNWGNITGTLRWNHLFNEKLFSNITAVYSTYDYNQGEPEGYFAYNGKTGIINYNLKTDFTYYANVKHKVDFGLSAILYQIEPGKAWPINDSSVFVRHNLPDEYAIESGVYISDEYKFNPKITISYGLRYSLFTNVGPGRVYSYEEGEERSTETLVDTLNYKSGEIGNNYGGFEPRLSLKYQINTSSSIKASYNRMRQYLHLISNTTAATPLDVWKVSNKNIKPQTADQFALGYFKNIRENTVEASVEIYYKNLHNLVDFRNGADLILNETLDEDLLQGKGRAYGIEVMLNKKAGRLTGWTSYTFSRTERKIETDILRDQINYGNWYPSNYDQPHKLNLVVLYQLSKRISVSTNFTYNTGRPATYPDAQYVFQGQIVPHYSTRNMQRIPDYHRMDISATLEGRGNKWWKGSWVFSVYNIYGRENAYSIFFRQIENTNNTETVKLSIIGSAIPSLSYNFKF